MLHGIVGIRADDLGGDLFDGGTGVAHGHADAGHAEDLVVVHGVAERHHLVGADAVPYRTRGNLTRVKLSFYYYLEKNRKIGRSQIINFL